MTKKPPLGIMPHSIWVQQRQDAISEAINRCIKENYPINIEWVEEYNKLLQESHEVPKEPDVTITNVPHEEPEIVYTPKRTAKWIFWPGWVSNHDKRIEDAQCSCCGYVHSVVYRNPNKLSSICPACSSKMEPNIYKEES